MAKNTTYFMCRIFESYWFIPANLHSTSKLWCIEKPANGFSEVKRKAGFNSKFLLFNLMFIEICRLNTLLECTKKIHCLALSTLSSSLYLLPFLPTTSEKRVMNKVNESSGNYFFCMKTCPC